VEPAAHSGRYVVEAGADQAMHASLVLAPRGEQGMSHTLKLLVGLLALLCLPALSACNTGADVEAGVSREGRTGTNQAGDAALSGEGSSGTIEEEEEGLPARPESARKARHGKSTMAGLRLPNSAAALT
jgi:hypothetical protein